MTSPYDEQAEKAKRDLKRITEEGDSLGRSSTAQMAGKFADRLKAQDIDENDKIELWGARVGRSLGLIAFIGLAIYLMFEYVLK